MSVADPREPAPGALRLVEDFLNTNDIEGDREQLATPGALRDWLAERGLLGPETAVASEDLTDAIELRDALRALAAAHNHLPADAANAVKVLNQAAANAQLLPRLTSAQELAIEPQASGVPGALGRIVAMVHQAVADGTLGGLKACERNSGRWAFYDQSKNQSGRWCHPAICGNRERSRRAYHRRRTTR